MFLHRNAWAPILHGLFKTSSSGTSNSNIKILWSCHLSSYWTQCYHHGYGILHDAFGKLSLILVKVLNCRNKAGWCFKIPWKQSLLKMYDSVETCIPIWLQTPKHHFLRTRKKYNKRIKKIVSVTSLKLKRCIYNGILETFI